MSEALPLAEADVNLARSLADVASIAIVQALSVRVR
jgi:hypothetical protein